MRHTPGPWMVADRFYILMDDDVACEVAKVCEENIDDDCLEQCDADARLIAAAPDLLRTCSSLLTMLEDVYEDDLYRHGSPSEDAWPTMLADARAVIDKAEGRSDVKD